MMKRDRYEFLRKSVPFSSLDDTLLKEIAERAEERIYGKGIAILRQGGPPGEYLWVIRKGRVKVFLKSGAGEEIIIDYRREGECFGMLSLMGGERSRSYVVADEETECLLIGKEMFAGLMEASSVFADFFRSSVFNRLIDKAYGEIYRRGPVYEGGDRLLFSTPLGDVVTKELATASQDISIRDAATMMTEKSISSLVLTDGGDFPAGIITDRDLREKVVSSGRDLREPVRNIMSVALVRAEASDLCFEAILRMIRHKVHHLLVMDHGTPRGIITNHDLMVLQGTSPLSLAREIEDQQTIEGLVHAAGKFTNVIGLLLQAGTRASNITKIIAEINDRLCIKVLQLAEKQMGAAPVRYCWIVFGSEGRKEQTFKTDQDNAIIYEDISDPAQREEAERYLSGFAALASGYLARCGFPLCPAGYMASNPLWRQPLGVWRRYFSQWINEPNADALLKSLIFFDFRMLYGDVSLAEELKDSLVSLLDSTQSFLGFMANMIVKNTTPRGIFGKLIVEKSGEYKNTIDLKIKGLAPLIDILRLFSLEKGVKVSSTLERIDALRDIHATVAEYAEDMRDMFEFIMLLRMQHQFAQITAGAPPDNHINPKTLSTLERKTLLEAFRLISDIQESVIQRYKAFIV
jgi:CBS domain-containing protein